MPVKSPPSPAVTDAPSSTCATALHRPRIALLRGRYLNPWEAQSYTTLLNRYDVVGFASHRSFHGPDTLGLPVQTLFAPDQRFQGSGIVTRALRRLTCRPELSDSLRGLEESLQAFDLLHTVETHVGFSMQAANVRLKSGSPLVATCWENIPFAYYDDPALRGRKSRVRPTVDRFLATTPSAASALRQEGVEDRRIRVVFPGVDLERFAPAPRDPALLQSLGLPADSFVVLYIGRLIREKGLLYLLLAARRFLDLAGAQASRVRFLFVGEGLYRGGLEAIATESGIRDSTCFAGGTTYDRLPDLHRLADVFVLPSLPTPYWQEQFGMVLAEAMACGRPVIAARSGSIPEVIGDAAMLAHPYDADGLAAALSTLWRSSALREEMAGRARAHAERRFDARRAADEIAAVYGELLEGR